MTSDDELRRLPLTFSITVYGYFKDAVDLDAVCAGLLGSVPDETDRAVALAEKLRSYISKMLVGSVAGYAEEDADFSLLRTLYRQLESRINFGRIARRLLRDFAERHQQAGYLFQPPALVPSPN